MSSGAAAEILTHFFGTQPFTDFTNAGTGMTPRHFGSFYEAAEEAALSRLYGGIHYQQSNDNGVRQGKIVGQSVLRHLQLN